VTYTNLSSFRLHTIAVAVGLILTSSIAQNAQAGQSALIGNDMAAAATELRSGEVVTGALPSSHPIHIEVALKLRNRDLLNQFVAAVGKGTQEGGKFMSHDQLMADHAPTSSQAQRVAAYLKQSGFTNIVIAPNRLLVSADGTAQSAALAFQASFARVKARDGRDTYANTGAAYIPASLKDAILSVVGLQDVHRPHLGLLTQAVTGHNPTEFSSIYGATGVATGAGVTVGIITQGAIAQTITDLNTFTANNGLATVVTQTVNTNGTSTDASGVGEWNLDSQDIVGMAGGQVGQLIFYNIPTLSNANLTADINTAVTANAAKIINVSLGECETSAQGDGSAAAQDQSFAVAVSQGQTFSISTGDSGSNECGTGPTAPSWPAASQYVIAAAGTTLDASTTTWAGETVWSGSGGSQSNFEPKPSWQTLWTGPRRGVADIALDADPNSGSKVIVNGAIQQIGGTSLSAPLFAGMWARVIAVKGTAVGFAGPLIYALPSTDFHDITSGNNGGSIAAPGYDLASGRGSLILGTAIGHIGGTSGGGPTPISNGVAKTGIGGAAGSDQLYTLDVPAGATGLKFVTAGGTGDSDLYVKFGSAPTTTVNDCKSEGGTTAESCSIATAQVGKYYVLIHGYATFSGVSLTGSYSTGGGGGGGTVLSNGVAKTGIAGAAGSDQLFTLVVPSGASSLKFVTSGGTGDSDLYVKFGSAPTTTVNDCKSEGGTTAETCSIATAQAGTYYVLVHGYATFSGVSLTGSYSTGGTTCGGLVLCSGVAVALPSVSTGGVSSNYTMSVPSGKTSVVFTISGGTGDADLYVNLGSAPTSTTYTCRPYLTGNNETCTFNAPTAGTYYINVRAYAGYSGVSLSGTIN
jgi:subtilase family serine protease